jgi:hypothetical protein
MAVITAGSGACRSGGDAAASEPVQAGGPLRGYRCRNKIALAGQVRPISERLVAASP